MNAPSRLTPTRLEPVWAVSEPKYGYVSHTWRVQMSDGGVRRFPTRFDALCFVNEHGAPTLKEQLAASLRETSERAESHFEETEAELGVMARDPDFDERFESLEDADPYTDDRSEEIE